MAEHLNGEKGDRNSAEAPTEVAHQQFLALAVTQSRGHQVGVKV